MKLVPSTVGRALAHNSLLLQKNSPGVLFGVGVVGMVGSTVLACRATLKMDAVLEEAKEKLEVSKTIKSPMYSDNDRQRDHSLIYFQTSVKIARLYAPAIVVGGISIAALTRSHNLLNKRNVALTAAYGALEKGFNEYRARVVDKYGEEEDRDFRYGTRTVTVVDPDDPEKMSTVKRVSLDVPSVYARFFDETSSSWNRQPEYNLIFLNAQQNSINDRLHARGHVFLNEVYDMLGLDRTEAGAVVGWVLSRNGETDNFIDFGVFNGKTLQARDFVNGREGSILLDFNVDGVIYNKIEKVR